MAVFYKGVWHFQSVWREFISIDDTCGRQDSHVLGQLLKECVQAVPVVVLKGRHKNGASHPDA